MWVTLVYLQKSWEFLINQWFLMSYFVYAIYGGPNGPKLKKNWGIAEVLILQGL